MSEKRLIRFEPDCALSGKVAMPVMIQTGDENSYVRLEDVNEKKSAIAARIEAHLKNVHTGVCIYTNWEFYVDQLVQELKAEW